MKHGASHLVVVLRPDVEAFVSLGEAQKVAAGVGPLLGIRWQKQVRDRGEY